MGMMNLALRLTWAFAHQETFADDCLDSSSRALSTLADKRKIGELINQILNSAELQWDLHTMDGPNKQPEMGQKAISQAGRGVAKA